MNKIIEKYVELMEKAEKEFLNPDDIKATKYNRIGKKLHELINIIQEKENYKEIYLEILNRTNEDKYWMLHGDLAESLYLKDKNLCLKIYKTAKWLIKRKKNRIEELEELFKEKSIVDDVDKTIEKYIDLMNKSLATPKKNTTRFAKFNKFDEEISKLRNLIKKRGKYREIYRGILNKTNEDKYWWFHLWLAESLLWDDTNLCLEIYRTSKWLIKRYTDRVKEIEELLKKGIIS